MIDLFFSLSSSFLFIAIFFKDKPVEFLQKENKRLHSENFISNLKSVLDKKEIKLKDIDRVFFTSNPSNQTGLRIGLSFVATLQVLKKSIELYHIDTLFFQSNLEDCISLLSINSQENKHHIKVFYQNQKVYLEKEQIDSEKLEEIQKQFPELKIKKNLTEVDFLHNFLTLKNHFELLKEIKEVEQ